MGQQELQGVQDGRISSSSKDRALTGCGAAAEKDLRILVDKLNINYKITIMAVKEIFVHSWDIVVVVSHNSEGIKSLEGVQEPLRAASKRQEGWGILNTREGQRN